MTAQRLRPSWLAVLVIVMAIGSIPGPAHAQRGGGFGFGGLGWGFGMFSSVPLPTTYLNQKSLVDAGRGYRGPSATPYAGNSNAYFDRVRDNGFVPRYSVERQPGNFYQRGSPGEPGLSGSPGQPAAEPSRARRGAGTAGSEPPARPVRPLTSFYTPDHHLLWPADAPIGDLKDKRSAADSAAAIVFSETQQSGVASLASVTDARQKLIAYGRPALEEIRNHDTAAVADLFHAYLLSLYDSLALAATPGLAAAK